MALHASLQFYKFLGELVVASYERAQPHEGAHDIDASIDGAGRVEHGGSHDRPVFGEGKGEGTPAAVTTQQSIT